MPEMRTQSDYVFSMGQADDDVYEEFLNPHVYSRQQWQRFVPDHRTEVLYVDCRNGTPQKMPVPRLEIQLAEQKEDIPERSSSPQRWMDVIMHLNAPYLGQEEDQEPEWRRGLIGKVDQPGDPQCTICLENVKCVALGCSHTFCSTCACKMNICAMCRAPIRIATFFRL